MFCDIVFHDIVLFIDFRKLVIMRNHESLSRSIVDYAKGYGDILKIVVFNCSVAEIRALRDYDEESEIVYCDKMISHQRIKAIVGKHFVPDSFFCYSQSHMAKLLLKLAAPRGEGGREAFHEIFNTDINYPPESTINFFPPAPASKYPTKTIEIENLNAYSRWRALAKLLLKAQAELDYIGRSRFLKEYLTWDWRDKNGFVVGGENILNMAKEKGILDISRNDAGTVILEVKQGNNIVAGEIRKQKIAI
ncbi:MAG: hypothetical protein ABH881_02335 [bacterium]